MKAIILLYVALLVGCSSKPVVVANVEQIDSSPTHGNKLDERKTTVDIDRTLLLDCEELIDLKTANPKPSDVLSAKASDALKYKDCKSRHKKLSDIVREAFNIQD